MQRIVFDQVFFGALLRVNALCVSFALVALGCGDDGGGDDMAAAGSGAAGSGSAAGSGAGMPSMGAAGSAGMAAGTGATAGTAGGTTGTAGMGEAGMGEAGMGEAGTGEPMEGQPTWTAIYREIVLGVGCNSAAQCHGGVAAATGGMLSMTDKNTAYMSLIDMPAMGTHPTGMAQAEVANCADLDLIRVVPGEPDMSLLMAKISEDPPPCGDRMPIAGLSEAQIEQVRTWILNGAQND